MNKYLINPKMRGMVQLKDDSSLELHDYTRSDIDWIYEIPADGTLSIDGTDIQNCEVKQDDLVILFYKRDGQAHRAIILDNAEWKENIRGIRQYAIEHPITPCDDCEACANCKSC